jgi:tetrahydromethanopterin S-methyltransferase subunit G
MVPLVDEQKIREAAARLEELEQKGATLGLQR